MRAVPITIVGNLTEDPELRFGTDGTPRARLTVAHNPSRYDQATGKWIDGEPSYYRVSVWRQLAENVAESLTKGARVIVSGTISERRWEQDGQKRSAFEITADAIGAELTHATATVRKMARNGHAAAGDDDWNNASTTRPTSPAPIGRPDMAPAEF